MRRNTLEEIFTELNKVIGDYLQARINLMKLFVLERISKAGTYFFSIVVGIVVAASLLLMLMFAFSFWYGNAYGSIAGGFLISAGFYAFVGIVVYVFRRPIFTNNLIKNIGKMLFYEEDEEE